VTGPYSQAQATRCAQALRAHVAHPATVMRRGTYRGAPVTHFVQPMTGVNVIRRADDAFMSGWRRTPAQLPNVPTRGSLETTWAAREREDRRCRHNESPSN
jgi:hypothetical protein